jgi:hypothetical protein
MQGEWVSFRKGSQPVEVFQKIRNNNVWQLTVKDLYDILVSHDIYIYFVNEEPHLMIYLYDGKRVNGVFGYGENNSIEEEYLDELKKQLTKFKCNHNEIGKVNNLIRLYDIRKRKDDLTNEDLEFLYQIKVPVKGFNNEVEDMLNEILSDRDRNEDIATLLNVSSDNITDDIDELDETTECFIGNLTLDEENINLVSNLKYVIGYIYIDNKNLRKDIHATAYDIIVSN